MVLEKERLLEAVKQIVMKTGTSEEGAEVVAHELVSADMMGMNSHGVLRLTQYVNDIEKGNLDPRGEITVIKDEGAMMMVDGGYTYGQIVGHKMAQLVCDKAEKYGIACVLSTSCRHVGRVGSYMEDIANRGLIGYAVTGVYETSPMAPFGAAESRLSTNPISWASPRDGDDPVFLDIATTVVAEGKLRSYILDGKDIPVGWVRDAQGRDTTDPRDLYGPPRGTIYPLGGKVGGAKGSGLAIMADMMTIALCNDSYWPEILAGKRPHRENSVFMMAVDPAFFCGREEYKAQVKAHCDFIKSAKPAEGVSEVLLPGDFEHKNLRKSEEVGVRIADDTWNNILALGKKFGCEFSESAEVSAELKNSFQF